MARRPTDLRRTRTETHLTRFPQSFLDEIRARLPVSAVVGRKIQLKKKGAELVGLSPFNKEKSPSFTVSDQKSFWHDFSSGKHGDIFGFLMETEGVDFTRAVEELAALAGVPLPADAPRHNGAARAANGATGMSEPPPDDVPWTTSPDEYGAGPEPGRRSPPPTHAYAYEDADGVLRYEVCRFEWVDGGRRRKRFAQRRPVDGEPGRYVWGLQADTYVRAPHGDFVRLTKDRAQWPGERREFDDLAHGLYRLPHLVDDRNQGAEAPTIWVPEGEKKVDLLVTWGLSATCNSGGAKAWLPHHAAQLEGMDVIILADNDKPGREGAHMRAASLRGIAKRIRVLDWRDHWPGCGVGDDVVDWAGRAGGTVDKLYEIADRLPDWMPPRPESSFGAFTFGEIDAAEGQLQWLVKNVLVRGGTSCWYGAPGCGKSFLATHLAWCVARGISWFGHRVQQGLAVYAAAEGGVGFKKRMRAIRAHNAVPADDLPDLVILPKPIDIFRGDDHVNLLIAEVKAWASYYDSVPELIVVDTLAAATSGADENSGKDMGPILARCQRMASETRAHVLLVHHTNAAGGKARGWTGVVGNVDTAMEVVLTDRAESQSLGGRQRPVREAWARKIKDAEGGWRKEFVLAQVPTGIVDFDGEAETSCVVEPAGDSVVAASTREVPRGYAVMRGNNIEIMRALVRALASKGVVDPPSIACPEYTRCVTVGDWQEELRARRYSADPDDPDGRKLRQSCKKAIERAYTRYGWADKENIIGKDREWVWRSTRRVHEIDPPPAQFAPEQPAPLLAPGESEDDALPF